MRKNSILLLFTFGLLAFQCDEEIPKNDCIDESLINSEVACTQEYNPVCGCDQITYSNACEARNSGVTSMVPGECG